MITDRDKKLLVTLTQLRYMTVKQIQETIFSKKSPSISYKRLDHLTKCKLIKRKYYNLKGKSNAYVYYLDKPPKKKNLRHELLISQFYVELKKLNYEILSFEKTPIFNGFIPDAIVTFKTDKNQVKKVFLEVQLSKHSIYEKYYNINPTNDDAIPKYLWVVTDQQQQQHSIRNLRIIIDDLKMTKLKNYFN